MQFALIVVLVLMASCKEKEPYKVKQTEVDAGKILPDVYEPPKTRNGAVLVTTSDGTLVLSIAGSSVDTKRSGAFLFADEKGNVKSLEIRQKNIATDVVGKATKAQIVLSEKGKETVLFETAESGLGREDVKGLPSEMVKSFYRKGSCRIIGFFEGFASFVCISEGFLGGAHGFAETELVLIDIGGGKRVSWQDLPWQVKDEALEQVRQKVKDDCLGRFGGVVPVAEEGGKGALYAFFTNSFEVCRGKWRLSRLEEIASKNGTGYVLEGKVLRHKERKDVVQGVLDFRASPEEDVVVALLSAGSNDRLDVGQAVEKRTREMVLLLDAPRNPISLGRTERILQVQFFFDKDIARSILEQIKKM